MKRYATALQTLASAVTVLAQCNTHTQTCVQNKVCPLIPFIKTEVRGLTFPDVTAEEPFIDITFSNIRVSQFDMGTASAGDTGSSITLTLNGISLKVDADWTRRSWFRRHCGTMAATASNSVVALSYRKSSTCPSANGIGCSMILNNYNLNVKGKGFGVIPRRMAPGRIRKAIKLEFCEQAKQQTAGLIPHLSCKSQQAYA